MSFVLLDLCSLVASKFPILYLWQSFWPLLLSESIVIQSKALLLGFCGVVVCDIWKACVLNSRVECLISESRIRCKKAGGAAFPLPSAKILEWSKPTAEDLNWFTLYNWKLKLWHGFLTMVSRNHGLIWCLNWFTVSADWQQAKYFVLSRGTYLLNFLQNWKGL